MPQERSSSLEEDRIRNAYARRPSDSTLNTWSNASFVFRVHERERLLLKLLTRYGFMPLLGRRILEVGCGNGSWLREFIQWGALPEHLCGVDLLPDRIAEARRRLPQGVNVQCGSAADLQFAANTFDVALQATVFTSILDRHVRQTVAAEMLRVTKDDGIILWYDFNVDNPRNPDVRAVKKREIYELFPDCRIELHRITLAPPVARWLVPRSWFGSYVLARLPFLCTHYLGLIRKA